MKMKVLQANRIIASGLLIASLGLMPFSNAYSAEQDMDRLMMTPEQRAKIDAERLAYLKSLEVKTVEEEEKEKAKQKAAIKRKIISPDRLAVSAIIETPEGKRLVRVNNQFNDFKSKDVKLNAQASNLDGGQFKVDNREVFVPVGNTYFTNRNKMVETYKLEQQAAKANAKQQILSADKKTIDRTLKDVKTVNKTPPNALSVEGANNAATQPITPAQNLPPTAVKQ
ncbi:hypothetical protein [Thiomicrorhabdus cannonii]|uniref:hypothetical protein n=1 Tax=Thiomicrorhabdus cannonii TaxID=2748011 RepID=UPI0015BA1B9C|nr:hypothetical protein [Thiomicrorhabdus cannonii]